ncbi:S66 family peptidase [Peribacillus deserti]|uniref:LD-carboxypeptidase n=1 Tax=Peribacillus deserti TaxID=673318 RepID=A0A2N5M3K4_9BACI|nr:S66 peptidase family protein [Peribacillus deserti]PLT28905.1 LD-carboxypeptidase [Peribacillus deserti]
MITYPRLKEGLTIGVTAPSSGVEAELHDLVNLAGRRLTAKGFHIVIGETVWTQEKAKSSSAKKRADEFTNMMDNEEIDILIPPWGGELLIEMLEHINFQHLQDKWVLGYSDISVLLLAITLKTGMATAHGTNLIDLRGESSDPVTSMWQTVLSTPKGEAVLQKSSLKYQKEWQHNNPSPCVFHLTEDTLWKTNGTSQVRMQGRLLGGCIDVIRHLAGTPYGDISSFYNQHIKGESIIWYFENCELSTTDLRRSLVQLKYAGWFEHCSGILFGRSAVNHPVDGYTLEDVYAEIAEELQIPLIYDIDCGHVPPQITFINGAYAVIETSDGKGQVLQQFI